MPDTERINSNIQFLINNSDSMMQELKSIFMQTNVSVTDIGAIENSLGQASDERYVFTMTESEFEQKRKRADVLIHRLRENAHEINLLASQLPSATFSDDQAEALKATIIR